VGISSEQYEYFCNYFTLTDSDTEPTTTGTSSPKVLKDREKS